MIDIVYNFVFKENILVALFCDFNFCCLPGIILISWHVRVMLNHSRSSLRPEIAKYTVYLLPKLYSGAYLTTLCECTILLITMTLIQYETIQSVEYQPTATTADQTIETKIVVQPRSVFAIARQRTFFIAVFGAFVSWSAMATQMSATPLAMSASGYSFTQVTTAVEYHLLGMFVPSFVSGILCTWFGCRLIMITGIIMQLVGTMLFQRGLQIFHFHTGLIIIGVGWNLGYVGASALLSECHQPNEKTKTHSLFEAIVMLSISLSFFSSGFAEQYFGWMFLTGKIITTYLSIATSLLLTDGAIYWYQKKYRQSQLSLTNLTASSHV